MKVLKFETICERVIELIELHGAVRFREVLHYMAPWTEGGQVVRTAIWRLIEQERLELDEDTGDLRLNKQEQEANE